MTQQTISVRATGVVDAKPDVAHVRIGCSMERDRAAEAFDACATASAAVLAALRGASTGAGELSTTGVQLSRRHDASRYVASNQVTVAVRPPERTGDVLAAAVDAGGDALAINGIEFSITDPTGPQSLARAGAVQSARRMAEELAAAAGVRIARLVSLSEGMGDGPGRRFAARAMPAAAPPVEVGDQEVSVSVLAVFEFE